jgi:hypothetical protein
MCLQDIEEMRAPASAPIIPRACDRVFYEDQNVKVLRTFSTYPPWTPYEVLLCSPCCHCIIAK